MTGRAVKCTDRGGKGTFRSECTNCDGTGLDENKNKCPKCTEEECAACDGTGTTMEYDSDSDDD